ncbi:hypothetical protein [Enterovibrio nigricans]|uniref:Uncharacterized protein n=1 Tax=Enterovibrio nigricans DSM 22720 TaxID=1121868 RepID=A0A1T4WEP4_9GAMM|nr:hypothetical protein [Enterovibrio nigricans]SKA75773.1 hypothetical protein SAMN02745132_04903 [Enterovibrio nigricans DSM 22720]
MPLLFLGLGGLITGAWWTKDAVALGATASQPNRPPYTTLILVVVVLFILWRKGWLS